jgi:hypothetical protein
MRSCSTCIVTPPQAPPLARQSPAVDGGSAQPRWRKRDEGGTSVVPSCMRSRTKQPPPMPELEGLCTPTQRAVAMAASTAFPPILRMSLPCAEHSPTSDATMPCCPVKALRAYPCGGSVRAASPGAATCAGAAVSSGFWFTRASNMIKSTRLKKPEQTPSITLRRDLRQYAPRSAGSLSTSTLTEAGPIVAS